MFDPATKLTYTAITGQREQSVRDVEMLSSKTVEQFMAKKGYVFEEKYVRAIRHWRLWHVTCEGFLKLNDPSTTTSCLISYWVTLCHGASVATTSQPQVLSIFYKLLKIQVFTLTLIHIQACFRCTWFHQASTDCYNNEHWKSRVA